MSDKGKLLEDAEVDFLLAEKGEQQAAAASAPGSGQTVTMRGDLEQINLTDIFQTLSMSKMEGVLHVRNPLEERQVYCVNGTVRIRVPRNAMRRLGQRLVQAGLLEPEQLRVALVAQRKEKLPLGRLLVRDGIVTEEQVEQVAEMQIAEDLFSLFTWRHGTFEFYKGELRDPSQREFFESCPPFEVSSLLLEVARRSDEWAGILDTISSLEEVPQHVREPNAADKLSETHQELLQGVDGQSTYRALAEQTTHGLFEVSRAARDLVKRGLLANVDDARLATVAAQQAADGQAKRALMMLQTLRDRPGDRAIDVVESMTTTLEHVGEKKLAGMVLLEAAQLQSDPGVALGLARRARDLAPRDPETNTFLRTTLIAHSEPNSTELEQCTLDLLDSLLDADLTTTALELVDDARATGTVSPQILLREAKARQKGRDSQGAIKTLMELAAVYQTQGDRQRLIDTYESILRLDRTCGDVKKALAHLRQTRAGRIARVSSSFVCVALLGGMGLVMWHQNRFDTAVKQAGGEIEEMLIADNRAGARERLAYWEDQLGACEPVEDLKSRVDFADAAAQTRLEKLMRTRFNDRMKQAASALSAGELRTSLGIYSDLWQQGRFQKEVGDTASTRLDASLSAIEQAVKVINSDMPVEPSSLFDRSDLTENLTRLQTACPASLMRMFTELNQMRDAQQLPEMLEESVRQRIDKVVIESKPCFARAGELTVAYDEALKRNDHERRLDPMFKAAVKREAAYDFAGALELYQRLEREPAGDAKLKAHFRDQVARNATICRLMEALEQATQAADFGAAQQQLRALKLGSPEVPFDRLVRLPLRVESVPNGAAVTCNDLQVGVAPITLSYVPADVNQISMQLPGFRKMQVTVTGDTVGNWTGYLLLEATKTLAFDHAIEVVPAIDDEKRMFIVDRSGAVTALNEKDGTRLWRFESEDLSGFLTRPLLRGDHLLVASLDGDLRALDRRTGKLAWSLHDLPTECQPMIVGDNIVLATTDAHLRCISLRDRTKTSVNLGEPAHGRLHVLGTNAITVGRSGTVKAHAVPGMEAVWQRQLELEAPLAALHGSALVLTDDHGRVRCLDAGTGAPRWSLDLQVETLGAPVIADQMVWITSPERLIRVDLASGKQRDGVPRVVGDWAGPAQQVGNHLVVPLKDGSLTVIDLATRAPCYRIAASRRDGSVLTLGDRLYVAQSDRSIDCYPSLR